MVTVIYEELCPIVNFSWLDDCVINLCRSGTKEEIKGVLFFMKVDKAPSSNGYFVIF